MLTFEIDVAILIQGGTPVRIGSTFQNEWAEKGTKIKIAGRRWL